MMSRAYVSNSNIHVINEIEKKNRHRLYFFFLKDYTYAESWLNSYQENLRKNYKLSSRIN